MNTKEGQLHMCMKDLMNEPMPRYTYRYRGRYRGANNRGLEEQEDIQCEGTKKNAYERTDEQLKTTCRIEGMPIQPWKECQTAKT